MKAVKVGKRGTIIVPAKLRKRYGIEEGTLVTAEARGDGVLIRPAVVLPVERYTPKRKAEFRLSSRLPEEEPWSIASSLSQQPVSSSICNGLVDMNLNAAPERGQDSCSAMVSALEEPTGTSHLTHRVRSSAH